MITIIGVSNTMPTVEEMVAILPVIVVGENGICEIVQEYDDGEFYTKGGDAYFYEYLNENFIYCGRYLDGVFEEERNREIDDKREELNHRIKLINATRNKINQYDSELYQYLTGQVVVMNDFKNWLRFI